MRLSAAEREAFLTAFDSAYINQIELDVLLGGHLNRRLSDILNTASVDASMPVVFIQLLEAAEQGGWILDLIEAAADHRSGNAHLQVLHQQVSARPDAAIQNPYDVCLLWGREPVFGRSRMKENVEALQDPTKGIRICVVDGPKGSGKSYTHLFITYLHDLAHANRHAQVQPFDLVMIDLESLAMGSSATGEPGGEAAVSNASGANDADEDVSRPLLRDIADEIAFGLGLDRDGMPTPGEEQAARWTRFFSAWLNGELQRRNTPTWIVFDVCKPFMGGEVGDLIRQLAARVTTSLPNVGLVLLNCEMDELPVQVSTSAITEEIEAITEEDIFELFRHILAFDADAPGDVEDRAIDHTARVLNRVDGSHPRYLWRLNQSVKEELAAIQNA